jgi:hypothetical protein
VRSLNHLGAFAGQKPDPTRPDPSRISHQGPESIDIDTVSRFMSGYWTQPKLKRSSCYQALGSCSAPFNFCFWSKADAPFGPAHLCFRGQNGHCRPLRRARRHQLRAAAVLPAARMIRMPWASTPRCWPGNTTVVEPNSSTIAGPSSFAPAASAPRSNTGVSRNLPSK